MSMQSVAQVGPFAKCSGPAVIDDMAYDAIELIIERTGDERLHYLNGENDLSFECFGANAEYEGGQNFESDEIVEIGDLDVAAMKRAFEAAFTVEIDILRECFSSVEICFGVVIGIW